MPKLKIMKAVIFFFILFFSCNKIFAQNDDFEFQRNFIKVFKYPESLKRSCTSTFTNILVLVNKDGEVKDILVSDSAPKSFKDEFNEIKNGLDLSLLKPTISNNKLSGCNILIPVFYVYSSDYCVNSFEPIGYIADNYFYFNGKKLDKLSFNVKPIINTMYKPIQ